MSKQTLGKLEAGNAATSLATLVRLLGVLGLAEDLDRLAADDELAGEGPARVGELRVSGARGRPVTRFRSNECGNRDRPRG